ncbi:MAG: YtxH domain-containing protein [Candidatus Caenarcaniphilales bacterium]|nr:YtxH domain-containing protein [Candidatus Caenarcaniphilales bacterium]
MSNNDNDNQGLITGLALGLLTGAALTLLYAPKSGRELRKELDATLRRKQKDLPKDFNNLLEDISDLYYRSSEFFSALTREQTNRLKNAVNEAQKVITEQTNKIDKS